MPVDVVAEIYSLSERSLDRHMTDAHPAAVVDDDEAPPTLRSEELAA